MRFRIRCRPKQPKHQEHLRNSLLFSDVATSVLPPLALARWARATIFVPVRLQGNDNHIRCTIHALLTKLSAQSFQAGQIPNNNRASPTLHQSLEFPVGEQMVHVVHGDANELR